MGSQDIWETRKDKTLTLVMALQDCTQCSGGSYHEMFSAARDLHEYLTYLMRLAGEDVLETMLLEPEDD